MDKSLWGKRIADKLHAGEKKIDESIKAAMDLVAEVQAAQADLSVSPVATDASLAKVMEALAALQTARSSMVASHRRMEKIGEGLGIRHVAIGVSKNLESEAEPVVAEHRVAV